MGRAVRGTVPAQLALLAGVLTGCSGAAVSDDAKSSASATESATASAAADAVESGGSVGATGSACELPVAFATAEEWQPEAVENEVPGGGSGSEEDDLAAELAEGLLRQGPFTAACEIDAKPAGNIGFIRVWTGESGAQEGGAEALLREFVAAEGNTSKAKYSPFTSDFDVSGTEVEYLYTSEVLEETKKERAFLAVTPDGPVVVHLGGFDTQEHEEMLPAYELARRTLRTT